MTYCCKLINRFCSPYHIGRNLADEASYRFTSPTIVGHFKFHWIPNLQMLNVAVELREMKEQASLAITTLYESIRVLKRNSNY